MSPLANQFQMRPSTLSGSPKKNAARFGSSKYSGGRSVGLVPTCQTANRQASNSACQTRRALVSLLLRIAFQHLLLHRMPDLSVQLDEARRQADLRDIARAR